MDWFFKPKYGLKMPEQQLNLSKEGLWTKCLWCKEIIYNREWEANLKVCPKCDHHYRLTSKERVQMLIDQGTFQEYGANLSSVDPIKFKHMDEGYHEKLLVTKDKTGLNDAIVTGSGKIHSLPIQICVMDFRFFGGSMATVMGEKIIKAINKCIKYKTSLLIVSCSGGARMQEGVFSLMQMAKTCAALSRLSKAKLLYISLLTDPTMGGVIASFASIGDITIAEPNALIGFAGPRVIEQTIKQKLPREFQRSEFLLKHGFIDFIVHRDKLKYKLYKTIEFFS